MNGAVPDDVIQMPVGVDDGAGRDADLVESPEQDLRLVPGIHDDGVPRLLAPEEEGVHLEHPHGECLDPHPDGSLPPLRTCRAAHGSHSPWNTNG